MSCCETLSTVVKFNGKLLSCCQFTARDTAPSTRDLRAKHRVMSCHEIVMPSIPHCNEILARTKSRTSCGKNALMAGFTHCERLLQIEGDERDDCANAR